MHGAMHSESQWHVHALGFEFTLSQLPLNWQCQLSTAARAGITSRLKCEDCALKVPSFGLPAEGRTRWCGGCAKAHVTPARRT